mgnify:CR=1 FL=1
MFRVKLRKADILFSEYIRRKAGWKCEACGKDYSNNHRGLHCSHYFSRSHESTRYDLDNALALCFYHHNLWGHGEGRDLYKEYMIKRLGQEGFDNLTLRANLYAKRDDFSAEMVLKSMLGELK